MNPPEYRKRKIGASLSLKKTHGATLAVKQRIYSEFPELIEHMEQVINVDVPPFLMKSYPLHIVKTCLFGIKQKV